MTTQPSPAEQFARRPPAERAAFLRALSDDEVRLLATTWRGFYARPDQLLPPLSDPAWATWLILAGRGWGKTRSAAEAIRELVTQHGYRHIGLIGRTEDEARSVMLEGVSGLLNLFPQHERPHYAPGRRLVTFHNGATARLFSASAPDQLRGPQHDAIWADELAAWPSGDAWEQAQFGLRLGERPLSVVSTTPRPTPLIRELLASATVRVTRGSTFDNAANLSRSALAYLEERYAGSALGRQELYAEVLDDTQGALWKMRWIDDQRVRSIPDNLRIVIGVDPAVTATGDETGIVVTGLAADGDAYVLADRSMQGTPHAWAEAVAGAYQDFGAAAVVAEVNQGGDLIRQLLAHHDGRLHIVSVRATQSKALRAAPVAARYEQGRVHHVGVLPELEDQLVRWVPGNPSPDRLDALVWALTHLLFADDEKRASVEYRRVKSRR